MCVDFSSKKLPSLMSAKSTAKYLGVEVGTLANWRCNGRYPLLKWVLFGRRVMYLEDSVRQFVESSMA